MNFSPSFVYQQLSLSVCECVWVIMYTHISYSGTVHHFQCVKLLWKTAVHGDLQLRDEKVRHRKAGNLIFSILRHIFWMGNWDEMSEWDIPRATAKQFLWLSCTKHSKQWKGRGWIELSCLVVPHCWGDMYYICTHQATGEGRANPGDPASLKWLFLSFWLSTFSYNILKTLLNLQVPKIFSPLN